MVRVRSRRKGSYFFVIDAFVAAIILIAAAVVLFTRFLAQPEAGQAFYTAEDLLSSLESTSVREFDSYVLRNWSANGTINDSSVSLVEQLGVFEISGRPAHASQLAAIVGQGVPSAVNYEILINGQSRYLNRTVAVADAEVFFSSKRIVLLHLQPYEAYDPPIVEVRTWQ